MSLRAAIVASLLCLVLSACAGGEDGPARGCPDVGLVRDLDRMTVFRGPGPGDASDMMFTLRLRKPAARCSHGDRGVAVETDLTIEAERGPASAGAPAEFVYFVAIADQNDTVIAKQTFSAAIPFAGNQRRVALRERLEPYIPYPAELVLARYRVILGLQLTAQQLAWNRRQRQRH